MGKGETLPAVLLSRYGWWLPARLAQTSAREKVWHCSYGYASGVHLQEDTELRDHSVMVYLLGIQQLVLAGGGETEVTAWIGLQHCC